MYGDDYFDVPAYRTLKEIIVDGFERGGSKRQFLFEDKEGVEREKSFAEVQKDTYALATYLHSIGFTGKKKIAIISENSYEWNAVYYAIIVSANIAVPVDVRLTADDLAKELADCACDAVFFSEKCRPLADGIRSHADVPAQTYLLMDALAPYLEQGDALLAGGLRAALDDTVSPDDLASIVYTSGTTGKNKGVMLTHKNIASNVVASCRVFSSGHGLAFLPLNHTYSWISGLFACLVRSEWGYLCTNLMHLYKDIKTTQPYNFAAVPMAVEMIYQNIIASAKRGGKYEALLKGIGMSKILMKCGIDNRRMLFKDIHDSLGGNLEFIMCGGAHLDPVIEEFMYNIGIQVVTGYGLTECSPCVTCSRKYEFKFGSVGLPLECCEVKIHEPDENGIGEIYVTGDNVMSGYYNDPVSTAEAFDGEWLKTGDYGYLDAEGYLYFTGRKKNLIILSNGKNVSPEEIENAMQRIEFVKEVLVYEEKDRIAAEFFLDTEKYPDAKERLKAAVDASNATMAEFKRVQTIHIRDTEFPKTTTLKIKRQYH